MFRSISNKIIILILAAIIVSALAIEAISVNYIKSNQEESIKDNIVLICHSGRNAINVYFNSIEQTVESMGSIIIEDYESEDFEIHNHMNKIGEIFSSLARNTRGVLTFYYRLEQGLYDESGFWYHMDSNGEFVRETLTDISAFDESDIEHVGWFYLPKYAGKALWLSPYLNENINEHMLSYVVPLYSNNKFIGVVGIDISYSKLAEEVQNIKAMETGYAFLLDSDDKVIYHPNYDYGTPLVDLSDDFHIADGDDSYDKYIYYNYKGKLRRAIGAKLENGMELFVTVDDNEITSKWRRQTYNVLLVSLASLVSFVAIAWFMARRITKPLKELTNVAKEVDSGNYDVEIKNDSKDEVGILAGVFGQLIEHLKGTIGDLNSKAYTDELTNVKNKTSFAVYAEKFDIALQDGEPDNDLFAVCMFDCNGLKKVNDLYGHDKGDIYLKRTCHFICKIFAHSPVFRIGGDEFAAILTGQDFENAEKLVNSIELKSTIVNNDTDKEWEKINFATGLAYFDPNQDKTFSDTLKRADTLMYINKKNMKEAM